MYIIVIAWVYVVFMMALSVGMEQSFLSGLGTFVFYCVMPLSFVLYVAGSPKRKKKRDDANKAAHLARQALASEEQKNQV